MLPSKRYKVNACRSKLMHGEKVVAGWLQAASSVTAEIMARSGFDVLFVDHEHGPGTLQNTLQQFQAISIYSVTAGCRIPDKNPTFIKKVLDIGAEVLVVPQVNDKKELLGVIEACLYTPSGCRGVAPSPRAAGYSIDSQLYLENINNELVIFAQIETKSGVENIRSILTCERLDGVFLGPNDLAADMGYFCQPNHPEVVKQILYVERLVKEKGKWLATIAPNYDVAHKLYSRGYDLVIIMSDTTSLGSLALEQIKNFREDFN